MRLTPRQPVRHRPRRAASRRPATPATTARPGGAPPPAVPAPRTATRCAGGAATRVRPRHRVHCRRLVLLVGWLLAAGVVLTSSAARADTIQIVALAQTIDEVLSNIRNWIMGILAGVAVVFLTIGGLRYLMASGDPGEIEKAKGAFKAAGIGFGLAALAPLVVEILKGIVGGV
ncbi:pilin [Amycolatopsis sp. YIM 10]|uniref:pilin n=1 Tax=Amycolatopsis sp. YIM 10 TaxID=2653857 RepID=UPI0012A843AC|nr:hypothetical protein YIM_07740 [Amycolatopsis sp. YIM 10]